jgi:hypothetical protein
VSSVEEERWQPDEALVLTVRTRSLSMKELSGPDRSWIVASLTVQGWTVAAIADRLRCSLRLVQTIKTEPMTRVALYALEIARELANERALRQLDAAAAASQAAVQQQMISRLSGQRDALLTHVQILQRARTHEVKGDAQVRASRRRLA